jgi:hypothetical protein
MNRTRFVDLAPRRPDDRRQGAPETPLFGELLVEAAWEPEGPAAAVHEGWLRERGLAPDRRGSERDRRGD